MTILITAAILLELEPSENLIRSLKQACIHAEIRTYVHTNIHTYQLTQFGGLKNKK